MKKAEEGKNLRVVPLAKLSKDALAALPNVPCKTELSSLKQISDKLSISVVDLTRIDLATEEDLRYEIDKWAKLFKATTWNPDFVHGCSADVITKSDP